MRYVYYRLAMSAAMKEGIEREGLTRRAAVGLIMDFCRRPRAAVRLADVREYLEFVSGLAERKPRGATLYFRLEQWERVRAAARRLDVSVGDLARLILTARFYAAGSVGLAVEEIARTLCARRSVYVAALTAPVCAALRRLTTAYPTLGVGAVARAAYLFYASGLGAEPPLTNPALYRVDGDATGWRRTSFRCGEYIRERIRTARRRVGVSAPFAASHTLYSFLQEAME